MTAPSACPDCGAADQELHRDGCPRLWWASPRDAALRGGLSDAECNAIYYARARAIARGEQPGSGDGVERDRDLIRWAYRAGAARVGIAREVPQDVMEALDRMCEPLDESRLSGATAAADARCMRIIRAHILNDAAGEQPPQHEGER